MIILVFPWGGRINAFTRRPVRYRLWTWVSAMNPRQGRFAWALLVWVALTDLYIRLDAATVLHDIRFF